MENFKEKYLLRPFAGLRPTPDLAQHVVAPPYDVVNTEEAKALARNKPWSFLHISKPEIDLPPGTDVFSNQVYAKARQNFDRMLGEGVLKRDSKDYYYIYRIQMEKHIQTGIVGAGSIEAYEHNLIRRHEYTRPDKETDRVRQIDALNAQTGPVFTTHKHDDALQNIIYRTVSGDADYHVVGDDAVEHTLWVVRDQIDIAEITRGFNRLGVIYIADGHHRSAAAARVAAARNNTTDNPTGREQYNSFLIVSFPKSEVKIYDYNRVVKDLQGLSDVSFLKRISSDFDVVLRPEAAKPTVRGNFGMYLAGKWYLLTVKNIVPVSSSCVDQLDISILTKQLLEPILGVGDPRIDSRIDFVGGIRGMKELEKRVDSGNWAVAFAVFPTTMDELMSIADAGEVMPPKSTWFEPKLADGMVSLVLE